MSSSITIYAQIVQHDAMFTFVNEKFSQILCIDSVVNIVVINLGKVGQTNTQFLGFRLVSMTSFTSLDITDNPSRVFVHRSRVARNQTRREGGGREKERRKRNRVETSARCVKTYVDSCRRRGNVGGQVRATEEIAA